MAIDLERLLALRIITPHTYTCKDVMLYALSLGVGWDPIDDKQLAYVYEKNLEVLPTFGGVMGYPGFWAKERSELGITWQKLLNGEQAIEIHRPLPVAGTVTGISTVDRIIDRGEGKGALLYMRREVVDDSDNALCTILGTAVLRGDGGFGGPAGTAPRAQRAPDREPDMQFDWKSHPNTALLYRLNGDFNPLHADPAVARQAGFERPILHGAASWGMAGYALLASLCDGDAGRFRKFSARFTSPCLPGDTQRTLIWHTDDGQAAFRVVALERGVALLDSGVFSYAA